MKWLLYSQKNVWSAEKNIWPSKSLAYLIKFFFEKMYRSRVGMLKKDVSNYESELKVSACLRSYEFFILNFEFRIIRFKFLI